MDDWKAKQAARASVAKALQDANPHLVPIGGKFDSLQAAAKNIRIELARAFPGVKFSVKSRRFSGEPPTNFGGLEPIAQKMREEFACGFESDDDVDDDEVEVQRSREREATRGQF